MFLFGQKGLCSGKSGCIREKEVVFVQCGCIWPKVLVFGQEWLYSCKMAVFG